MADTTTTNYGFTLPEVGASEDTWGTKLNQNWTDVDADLKAIDDKLDGTTPVTGIDINSGTIDGVTIGGSSAGAVTATNLTATGTTTLAGATTSADINFGDNDKAIFGAGSDLEIFHDGSNSYIKEAGTGSLLIRGVNLSLQDSSNGENYLVCQSNNEVSMYFDGSKKLATTSTGIDVTGTATMDGLTVVNNSTGTITPVSILNTDSGGTQTATRMQLGITNSGGANYVILEADEGGVDSFAELNVYTGSTATKRLNVNDIGDISFYEDTGTTAKFFWDASAESLGIGTSSPNCGITVSKSGVDGINLSYSASPDSPRLFFTNDTPSEGIAIVNGAGALKFNVGGAIPGSSSGVERMRIDSSGNLLVGRTSSSETIAGAELNASGHVIATRDGGEPLILNRQTSDGIIARFRKDGTTVGSIGTQYGNLVVSSGDSGLLFYENSPTDTQIVPCKADGTLPTNDINLGNSGRRFKDLYLSGGVYLGGTGSANYLDDYEEGTWTATDVSGASPNLTLTQTITGTYTKVGNLVYVQIYITYPSTTDTSTAIIGGLPFPVANGYPQGSARVAGQGSNNITVQLASGTSSFQIRDNDVNLTNNQLSDDYVLMSATYQTL